jgi:ribosomal protein S18 acetylase RimI-like enzyme
MAATAETGGCGYVHPGDIPHRLYNGNKYFDPAEVMTIWEDGKGIAAWVHIGPRHKSYDAQVRPDLRGAGFERSVLEYADERTVELMRQYNVDGDRFHTDAYQCDVIRSRLLAELGWELEDRGQWILNRTELTEIHEPVLPKGYKIRAARGIEDAKALAEVHKASFGSEWTTEMYRKVMQSPGYAPERELVVEAPDGSFAAFTVTWYDPLNRIGYFEPVGTHKDHRRIGLGRAILLYGMQKMAAVGMECATVANNSSNEAARELYKACGFKPWHKLDDYSKPVSI